MAVILPYSLRYVVFYQNVRGRRIVIYRLFNLENNRLSDGAVFWVLFLEKVAFELVKLCRVEVGKRIADDSQVFGDLVGEL